MKGIDDCGLSYIWHNQSFSSISSLKRQVFHSLLDQFTQSWRSDVFASPKGMNHLGTSSIRKLLKLLFKNANYSVDLDVVTLNYQ